MNKETIVGVAVILVIFGVIAGVTGLYGVFYIGLAFIVAMISIFLFSRKSAVAKTGAVILNTDLIYKILMPKKYKSEIKELEEKESHEKT